MAGFEQAGGGELGEFGEVLGYFLQSVGHSGFPIAVGASLGFGHDVINQAEFLEIDGGYAEGLGGLGGKGAIFPENASASFGRDD